MKLLLRFLTLLAASAITLAAPAQQQPPATPPHPLLGGAERILFLGDSITQDGRYVAYLHSALLLMEPETMSGIEVLNLGLSGETASGLTEKTHNGPRSCVLDRLDAAIDQYQPQLTFICYGMNDGIYHPLGDERFAAYREGIRTMIDRLQHHGSEVILLTPPVFDPKSSRFELQDADAEDFGYRIPYRNYSSVLQEYGWWLLSQHDGVDATVDLYAPLARFIETAREENPDYRYGDGVHPANDGHMLMAVTILEALGVPAPTTAPKIEMRENTLHARYPCVPGTLPPIVTWPEDWYVSPFIRPPGIPLPKTFVEIDRVALSQLTDPPVTAIIPVRHRLAHLDLAPELPFHRAKLPIIQAVTKLHRQLGRTGRQAVAPDAPAAKAQALVEARKSALRELQRIVADIESPPLDLTVEPAPADE